VDLSQHAGKTLDHFSLVTEDTTEPGFWEFYFQDLAMVASDGTVFPIYTREPSFSLSDDWSSGNSGVGYEINHWSGYDPATTTTYYHGDHLGSERLTTSENGYPTWSATYAPYGMDLTSQITVNHNKFTGKERDSESGLDNFGARYNSSQYGRFMSPDSGIDQHPENPQSWNLYSYVQNNPVNIVDPSGEFTCDSQSVSTEQCENAHKSADEAAAKLASIKATQGEDAYKDAKRAVDALGGRKDNGVVLKIGDSGNGYEGSVEIGPNQAATKDNPTGQNISVTLTGNNFDGSNNATEGIMHEGSHVADASDWIATGFNPSAAVNSYKSEFKAYTVEASFAQALNNLTILKGPSGNNYPLWGPSSTPSGTAVIIRSILWNEYGQLGPGSKIVLWQSHTKGGH